MPQTVSPLTTCGPSAGSPPPDWKSRKAWAIASVSKTTPWVAVVAFQTMVSPGLTATLAAEPPPLGTQVGVPLRMVPSISTVATGAPAVAREPLMARPCWLQKKPRVVPGATPGLTVAWARRVPCPCAASGAVPQTVSPLTTCGPSAGQPAAGLEVEEGEGDCLGVEDDAVGGRDRLPDDGVAGLDGDARGGAAGLGHPGGRAVEDGAVDLDGRHRAPAVAREPLMARPCWLQKKPSVVPGGRRA